MTENLAGYGAYEQPVVQAPETMVALRLVLSAVKYHLEILEADRAAALDAEDFLEAGKLDFAAIEMSRLFRRLLELGVQ